MSVAHASYLQLFFEPFRIFNLHLLKLSLKVLGYSFPEGHALSAWVDFLGLLPLHFQNGLILDPNRQAENLGFRGLRFRGLGFREARGICAFQRLRSRCLERKPMALIHQSRPD